MDAEGGPQTAPTHTRMIGSGFPLKGCRRSDPVEEIDNLSRRLRRKKGDHDGYSHSGQKARRASWMSHIPEGPPLRYHQT